jgi:hypothetical protein
MVRQAGRDPGRVNKPDEREKRVDFSVRSCYNNPNQRIGRCPLHYKHTTNTPTVREITFDDAPAGVFLYKKEIMLANFAKTLYDIY